MLQNPQLHYLDNAATTATRPQVLEAMLPYFTQHFGNPSSIHSAGRDTRRAVENARRQVAAALGCEPREIYFTAGGSESDNWALKGVAFANRKKGNHIITSAIEHHAVLHTCGWLERHGFEVTYLPVDEYGRVNPADVEKAITDQTILISIMFANNEIGTIQPIAEIAKIAKAHNILFHTDAVQAVGKVPMKLSDMNIDFLSLSGHKLHAPKGVGALYVKRGVRFRPFIVGGHQESGRRAGTENVASVVGLGKAAELARLHIDDEHTRVRAMRDKLEQTILKTVPSVRVNGDPEHRLPNTSNISFEYIEGESILMLLDMYHICASSGSACTTGSLEPSHVLRAMGIPYTAAHGAIRFSLSRYNTMDEVDFVLEKLPPVIARLREISPYWK